MKDYTGLARDGFVAGTRDPSDAGVWTRIEAYPGTLVDLPDEAWDVADFFPLDKGAWAIVVALWTLEEGRSDLSLEGTIRERGDRIELTISAVHVM